MTLHLGSGAAWSGELADDLAGRAGAFDALLVGPGLGRLAGAAAFLGALLRHGLPPLVLDADALFLLAKTPDLLGRVPPGSVLTPHPGEMARLSGRSAAEIQADRQGAARRLSERLSCVVVLKGASTVVAAPGEPILVSPWAEPNLAVGGTGDVLAGLAGALLARGLDPLQATALAVHWHGAAGALLSRTHPFRGNLAGEVADALPRAMTEISACRPPARS